MPQSNPGSLPAGQYADLVAYILSANSIVAGNEPLPSDFAALSRMLIPAGGFSFMAFSPYQAKPAVDVERSIEKLTAVSDATIAAPPSGDWLTWRRGYDGHGFSPLDQINTRNVDNLRLVWSWTMPSGSNENVPLVHDGTLLETNAVTL